MIYRENMLIQMEQEQFRIVDYDKIADKLCLINMDKKCSMPFVVSAHEIEELFNKNEAHEIIDNRIYANKILNEKLLNKRDFYYQIICFILAKNTNYELYYKNTRAYIINEASEKFNVSYSTVKRILCIYLQSGKIRDSLVDNLQNCGGKGKDRIIKNRKNGVVIDNNIKKLFKEGINKYYNTQKKNSIRTCYELIIRDYLKEDKDREIPTFKQFYYWYTKFSKENKQIEISKRFGDRIYQQTSRAIVGNSIQDTLAPADLYQIDSTILDVYIVSKLNRNLIIGRPVLYLVIDTYSRLIVGINVTIEPFNSYTGVQGALINAMIDKVSYCKRFNINIEKKEWDVNCIPNRILADRGELLSADIENAIANLGIMIQNTPPYRGDMKGIVEKSFERIHSYIKPFCDGIVENKFNKVERGADDYRLKANLTLHEITQIIIKCVLFYNNHHVLEYYQSDGLTIENNISKIPYKIWQEGIKSKKGLLRELAKYYKN
ncbi:DDE-type integrase/transposase/recombinase [Clostridium butyricum]|uniref:DDE-type integrase/transposase/recombinase n=1 Tax=Clostridium butyricum TaxID=1492 RepID=UPI002ABDF3D4|nr:DDE-type integrase/transposase/recombinase [Clostridium butyricum]